MSKFVNSKVVVVGGGSGIGKAVAALAAAKGASVTLSSRNQDKLIQAAKEIPGASPLVLDMIVAESRSTWIAALTEIDHLVISAAGSAHGPFAELADERLRDLFEAKFFGPYLTVKAALPKLKDGGSITLFSGVLSRRPGLNCSGLGAVNGAVESLARALALELGPKLRVNCVSPGMIRSEAYAGVEPAARERMYEETGSSLPVGRVGFVEEAAAAALFLMTNGYTTGVVQDVDGGHMIRQYATR